MKRRQHPTAESDTSSGITENNNNAIGRTGAASSFSSSIKENDGKAAQEFLVRRILLAIGTCFVTILFLKLISDLGGDEASSRFQLKLDNKRLHRNSNRVVEQHLLDRNLGLYHDSHEHGNEDKNGGKKENLASKTISVSDKSNIEPILTSTVHLIDLHIRKLITNPKADPFYYDGIEAEFCTLDWSLHYTNPSSVPMFRDLISHSPHCRHNRIIINLKDIAQAARNYDEHHFHVSKSTKQHIEQPSGVIFHESRCGSTLLANALAYLDPQHSNRVYSEAGPPLTAMRICGEDYSLCPIQTASQVLKDVVYLMGRYRYHNGNNVMENINDDTKKQNGLFFKFQSVAARNMQVFTMAFPTSPWIFLYRDPIQVLVSQMVNVRHIEHANCLRTRKKSPPSIIDFAKKSGSKDLNKLTNEEYCAIHLATICENALDELRKPQSFGTALEYKNIQHDFATRILSEHFGLVIGSEERKRIDKVSQFYSKVRGSTATGVDNGDVWEEDNTRKDREATEELRAASDLFLDLSYVQLQEVAK